MSVGTLVRPLAGDLLAVGIVDPLLLPLLPLLSIFWLPLLLFSPGVPFCVGGFVFPQYLCDSQFGAEG